MRAAKRSPRNRPFAAPSDIVAALFPPPVSTSGVAEPDGKQPFAIVPTDAACFGFAGLWEHWTAPDGSVLETSAVVTTAANALMATIHDRMPVILDAADYQSWMQGTATEARADQTLPGAERMRAFAVGKAVGNVRNNSAELIAPLESTG